MNIKFSPSEMAKNWGISKQTLLYYDKIGLFCPKFVDESNRYRYYAIEQCQELSAILSLKNLGMPLKRIKTYIGIKDLTERIHLLNLELDNISSTIFRLQKTQLRIQALCDSFRERINARPFEMGIRNLDKMYLYEQKVAPPYDLRALECAIGTTITHARKLHNADVHALLVIVKDTPSARDLYNSVAVHIDEPSDHCIAAGNYGYMIHKGSMWSLRDSRNKLIQYLHGLGFQQMGKAIERVLLDHIAVPAQQEYMVEILLPIAKVGST
jgi:DNA-binding transcriptional MerR regulator/effector-binding domain-containing protein